MPDSRAISDVSAKKFKFRAALHAKTHLVRILYNVVKEVDGFLKLFSDVKNIFS